MAAIITIESFTEGERGRENRHPIAYLVDLKRELIRFLRLLNKID